MGRWKPKDYSDHSSQSSYHQSCCPRGRGAFFPRIAARSPKGNHGCRGIHCNYNALVWPGTYASGAPNTNDAPLPSALCRSVSYENCGILYRSAYWMEHSCNPQRGTSFSDEMAVHGFGNRFHDPFRLFKPSRTEESQWLN